MERVSVRPGNAASKDASNFSPAVPQHHGSGRSLTATVPPIVSDVLRSSGEPLTASTRAHMEPHFSFDFSKVRVHADAKASASARAVNALAYTVGNRIAVRADKYAPGSTSGQRLLAHELAHVVQQARGGEQSGPEARAELAAERIARNQSVPFEMVGSAPQGLYRLADEGSQTADDDESQVLEDGQHDEANETGEKDSDPNKPGSASSHRSGAGLQHQFDELARSQAPSLFAARKPLLFPGQLNLDQLPKQNFSMLKSEPVVPAWAKDKGLPKFPFDPNSSSTYGRESKPPDRVTEELDKKRDIQDLMYEESKGPTSDEDRALDMAKKLAQGFTEAYFPEQIKAIKGFLMKMVRRTLPLEKAKRLLKTIMGGLKRKKHVPAKW
jgi:hypothetical protein